MNSKVVSQWLVALGRGRPEGVEDGGDSAKNDSEYDLGQAKF